MNQPVVVQQTRYDTARIAEGERLEFWQDVVGALFPPADVSPSGAEPFSGAISQRRIGTLAVARICSVAQRVRRSPSHIGRGADDVFELNFQLAGRGFLAQDGREVVTASGQFALYDSTRPYEMRFDGPFRQLTVKFPRSMLNDRLWIANRLTALGFSWRSGPGRLALSFLRALDRLDSVDDAETITRLQDNALDLLATVLRDSAVGRREAGSTPARERALERARQFILTNLDDPELSVQAIAEASHVSIRTLYTLFGADACTPGKWIQEARLEACRRDLEDPLQARRTILDIAFAHGFNDAAHFSRLFRSRYGTAPRAWSALRKSH
jgi:AraC-like DNA-binding protein